MKLVITTQYQENYGAHDWDGKGSCPQYWKMKGGSTYVVENLTPAQCRKAIESGCPTLRGLIEYADEGSREDVVDVSIMDDDEKVCEDWDTVTKMSFEGGKWVARKTIVNDEYGYLNRKIAVMSSSWDMLKKSGRENYKVVYTLRDGREVVGGRINEVLVTE